jgi:dephospho-CoA kinase
MKIAGCVTGGIGSATLACRYFENLQIYHADDIANCSSTNEKLKEKLRSSFGQDT